MFHALACTGIPMPIWLPNICARSLSLRVSVSVIESLNDAKWPCINLGCPSQQQQQRYTVYRAGVIHRTRAQHLPLASRPLAHVVLALHAPIMHCMHRRRT
jgi:hypothetical protein